MSIRSIHPEIQTQPVVEEKKDQPREEMKSKYAVYDDAYKNANKELKENTEKKDLNPEMVKEVFDKYHKDAHRQALEREESTFIIDTMSKELNVKPVITSAAQTYLSEREKNLIVPIKEAIETLKGKELDNEVLRLEKEQSKRELKTISEHLQEKAVGSQLKAFTDKRRKGSKANFVPVNHSKWYADQIKIMEHRNNLGLELERRKQEKFHNFDDLYRNLVDWATPLHVREARAKAAEDAFLKQLDKEEKARPPAAAHTKSNKKKRKNNTNDKNNNTTSTKATTTTTNSSEKRETYVVSENERLQMSLHEQVSSYRLDWRVRRWEATTGTETFGKRYANMKPPELKQSRRLHFLPGIPEVLCHPLGEAFFWRSGNLFGVVAIMRLRSSNKQIEKGVIYIEVDQNNYIFHLFLTPYKQLPQSVQEVVAGAFVSDMQDEAITTLPDTKEDSSWTIPGTYEYIILVNKQLKIIYPKEDYDIYLLPLKADLVK